MAEVKQIKGSLFQVSIGDDDTKLKCQLDASITITQDMDSEDGCKQEYTEEGGGVSWKDDTPGDKSWEISGSGKVTEDEMTELTLSTADILAKHVIESDEPIIISVGNVNTKAKTVVKYSGMAQLTSFTINYPATGAATYDYTATGRGKLTQTRTPAVGG